MTQATLHEKRKELKRSARRALRTHYGLLTLLCAMAMLFGMEFPVTSAVLGNSSPLPVTVVEPLPLGAVLDADEAPQGARLDALLLEAVGPTSMSVINDLLENDVADSRATVDASVRTLQSDTPEHAALGHTRGVLAAVVNAIVSGGLLAQVATIIHGLGLPYSASAKVIIVLLFLGSMAIWVLLQNMIPVMVRRPFMEARLYKEVPFSRVFYPAYARRWLRCAMTMLACDVFLLLWFLTIVGGVVKFFSYALVPFIAAENPGLGPREAIGLSCRMMRGHKGELACLYLSFAGWRALGVLTFGLSDIAYTNPYLMASLAEFYAARRAEALATGVAGAREALVDDCLFERAPASVLTAAYADVVEEERYVAAHDAPIPGWRGFFARHFRVWIGSLDRKRAYQRVQDVKASVEESRSTLRGEEYPRRLGPFYAPSARSDRHAEFVADADRCYTLRSLALLFFALSIGGWAFECCVAFLQSGGFVNRGMLHGPWLPIYGIGGVITLALCARFRRTPVAEFAVATALCGVIEFGTSVAAEALYGHRWWDYTGYFLNVDGRVCAEGLLVFGIGCVLVVYLLGPSFDEFVTRMPPRLATMAAALLVAALVCDVSVSRLDPNAGAGVTTVSDVPAVAQAAPARD